MNRARVYSGGHESSISQRSSLKRCLRTHLPKTERQNVTVDIGRLQAFHRERGHFRRPYPYTDGDNSNGHEEHEWEPVANGPPVRQNAPWSDRVTPAFRVRLTIL